MVLAWLVLLCIVYADICHEELSENKQEVPGKAAELRSRLQTNEIKRGEAAERCTPWSQLTRGGDWLKRGTTDQRVGRLVQERRGIVDVCAHELGFQPFDFP